MSWTLLCSGRLECSATGNPPLVAGLLFETLHWTQVFTETTRKPSISFAIVQLVTALAAWQHRLHKPQCSWTIPLAERLRWRLWSLSSFPWSHMCGTGVYRKKNVPAGEASEYVHARPQCAMNQDVSEICIRPINTQRLGVEKFLCSWVNGQKTEVLARIFLNYWFFGKYLLSNSKERALGWEQVQPVERACLVVAVTDVDWSGT